MKKLTLPLFFILNILVISGQKVEHKGHFHPSNTSTNTCLSETSLEEMKLRFQANRKLLSADPDSKYSEFRSQMIPKFEWPVKQAPGINKPGYYVITNYVDMDPTPGIQDYIGGSKTYDSHNGLDILLAPHSWNKMYDDEVWAIAAAPGIVIDMGDGNVDDICAFTSNPPNWNFISIEHSDGTVSVYGHQRTGSIPQLAIGSFVNTGDYLGIIGSSGNSTAPHLHFMVLDVNGNLVEPFKGPMNNIPESYWIDQHEYREASILEISSNSNWNVYQPCPNRTDVFPQEVFYRNDEIFFQMLCKNSSFSQSARIEVYYEGNESSPPVFISENDVIAVYDIYSFGWYVQVDVDNFLPGRYSYKVTLLAFDVEIDSHTSEFWIVDACAENLTLIGLQDNGIRFADKWIDSRQLLVPNSNVRYRAGDNVVLKPGFYAPTNTKFQAKLDFQCPN